MNQDSPRQCLPIQHTIALLVKQPLIETIPSNLLPTRKPRTLALLPVTVTPKQPSVFEQRKVSEILHVLTPIAAKTNVGLSRKINFSSSDLLKNSHNKLKSVEKLLKRVTSDFSALPVEIK